MDGFRALGWAMPADEFGLDDDVAAAGDDAISFGDAECEMAGRLEVPPGNK